MREQIADAVRVQLRDVAPGAVMEVCGSFRRGKPDWCVPGVCLWA